MPSVQGCSSRSREQFVYCSFLNAYRQFVGRRGPVRHLRSDQGTNFVGAKNELQQALSTLHHEKIQQELAKRNCDWIDFKMNVPEASHMGGTWERQIRTVRNVLSTLLTQHAAQLDDETLRTFMGGGRSYRELSSTDRRHDQFPTNARAPYTQPPSYDEV